MASKLRVIVSGLIGQHPLLGGMTWHYLQYVLGFDALGHDVYYVEDSGEWPYNLDGGASGDDYLAHDCDANVAFLQRVMAAFNLGGRWAYRCPVNGEWLGTRVPRSVDLVVNVSGSLASPERYRDAGTLVYVDTDPVFTQLKLASGQKAFREKVDAHDVHFSFGETVADRMPATGHRWIPTRQPVVLSQWHPSESFRDTFTTVMNWSSYTCETYDGRTYGQKDVEFARFLDLPARAKPVRFEIAVRGTRKGQLPEWGEGEREPGTLVTLLQNKGWGVVDAIACCGDYESYRRHIEGSKAEWTVAKNAYVDGRSGWLGDRSPCYLAAGRPVVVQDTGFGAAIPAGHGIVAFSTLEEAAEAVRSVHADYAHHARAARHIAEEYFDAARVLNRLTDMALAGSRRQTSV